MILWLVAHVRIDKNMFLGETPPPKNKAFQPQLVQQLGGMLTCIGNAYLKHYSSCIYNKILIQYLLKVLLVLVGVL